ncbi:MAG: hypothetical protein ACFHX7_24800 [Pseudomonadota bacterium]
MCAPHISRVRLAAAHEGVAELIVDIRFENGGVSEVALDAHSSNALMTACRARTADELVGHSWTHVRDALSASFNRF